MIVFLDTDVLIECLRGKPEDLAWLKGASSQPVQIPGIVAMELLAGCRDKADQQRTIKFLASYPVVWPEAGDFAQAYALLAAHRLSSGLSIPDSLIAAMALAHSARLHTFNRKHFQAIPGLDVQEPYERH